MKAIGYHKKVIRRGTFGQLSKLVEEVEELEDAEAQGVVIMMACEMADIYGALRAYAQRYGYSMRDLAAMADVTARAFDAGIRKERK